MPPRMYRGRSGRHLGRRPPIWPFPLHADRLGAGPREALPTDTHAVLDGLTASEDVIEAALTCGDHHGARSVPLAPRHDLAGDRLHTEDVEELGKPSADRVIVGARWRREDHGGSEHGNHTQHL